MRDLHGNKECATHHYACDCREALFKELQAKLDRLTKAAQDVIKRAYEISDEVTDYGPMISNYLILLDEALSEIKKGESDE